jgi:23S rRNA (cytidine1920-2'-O)/16S rRNA (cytidine1409-2'-O)-methyltransferase
LGWTNSLNDIASVGHYMPEKSPKPKIEKQRLDLLLVERGLAESRQKAQAMLLAGEVRIRGERHDKPGERVPADAPIEITETHLRYASRGGFKLEGALDDFGVDPKGKVCLDVGSSTGGFTDCLLQRGASHVYAVDVTPDQMAWKLQHDPRVTRIKRNARELTHDDLTAPRGALAPKYIPPQLVVIDLAFISVAKVLSAVVAVAALRAEFLILIKPQFELDRGDVGKGGIVRDAKLHERAIERVRDAARLAGLQEKGVKPSKLPGAEGNLEFFLYATRG